MVAGGVVEPEVGTESAVESRDGVEVGAGYLDAAEARGIDESKRGSEVDATIAGVSRDLLRWIIEWSRNNDLPEGRDTQLLYAAARQASGQPIANVDYVQTYGKCGEGSLLIRRHLIDLRRNQRIPVDCVSVPYSGTHINYIVPSIHPG